MFFVYAMAALLSSSTVHAGKLAGGFRGKPFEEIPADQFQKPLDSCREGDREGVIWTCDTTIAEQPVLVRYMHASGVYWGYALVTTGSDLVGAYALCQKMLAVYEAAYGTADFLDKYRTGTLDRRYWVDGTTYATFEYKQTYGWCELMVFDTALYDLVKRRIQKDAAKGVDDL